MFNIQFPKIQTQTIAVKLKPTAEKRMLQSAHPWIYSESIDKINKKASAGDIAILFRQKTNKVFGVGLFDPDSPISIKMLHYYEGITVNRAFFSNRIIKAFEIRKPLLQTDTDSYRLIFGENDGLPGFILDCYSHVAVLKLYSAIWCPYLKELCEIIIEVTKCQALVLRLSRNMQHVENDIFYDGQILYGTLEDENVLFKEHGVSFAANVIKGHKTGYFLDHRENRRKVGALAKEKTVLDVFAYAGGFTTHALFNGATAVTSVDISKQALELAKHNVRLNNVVGKHITIDGDAFSIMEGLKKEHKQYDIVVIDPPSFAKRESEIEVAKKKYRQLARLGSELVATNGYLILASCSSRITSEVFFSEIEKELSNSSIQFKLLEHTFHDIDHPVTFKEGAYLKCAYYQRK